MNTALSGDGGASWGLQIGSIVPIGAQSYGSDVSGVSLPSGGMLQAWAGTLGTWVHAGLDPAAPNVDYQAPLGQYGYDPGLAVDADGATTMAWFSNATGATGVWAQAVGADASPAGPARRMPGTQVLEGGGTLSRTPIVARDGGGFYVAYPVGYPTSNQVRLWRVGDGRAIQIAKASGNTVVAVAPDNEGRLW